MNNAPAVNTMTLREIPVTSVCVGQYQKKLNKARVLAIFENFDPDRMRPIEVSYREGRFWCFDGQHRLEVYRLRGASHIPAIVHHGLTYEQEASLFARQQDHVGTVRSDEKWKALLEAKDPASLSICNIVHRNGFIFKPHGNGNPPYINCIAAVQHAWALVGAQNFNFLMTLVQQCFANQPKATSKEIISGLAEFLSRYPLKPYFNDVATCDHLFCVLNATSPNAIINEAESYRADTPSSRASARVASVLVSLYNQSPPHGHLNTRFAGR